MTHQDFISLFDSANDWAEATRRLIGRKRYDEMECQS